MGSSARWGRSSTRVSTRTSAGRSCEGVPAVNRFVGKVAVVSGASSVIGLAIARRLGTEGAKLVVVCAPTDEQDLRPALVELEALGVEVEGVAAVIAEETTAADVVELARSRFGGLDVLVNNAGI